VLEVEELLREERQQAGRSVTYSFDEDGSLVLKARLPAEAGMLVLKALDAAISDLPLPKEDCVDPVDVPAGTSQRHACDCSYVRITEDDNGEPLNVGRKTRSIPPAMRRALNSRDQGCVFPGCTHRKYVDGRHVHHWAEGGETKLGNLVSLCRFHDGQVHEGGRAHQSANAVR
jgi:hypothetical protein